MAKNYKQTAADVLRLVGGEKNVAQLEHCSTRLRFSLTDSSKADVDALKKTPGVMGVITGGPQCQVVIGNDVIEVYRGRFSYLPADRQKYISARALGSNYDRDRLLRIFAENARTTRQNNPHWAADDPMAILFIKSDLRLVVDLQTCVKAQQSRTYAQKVKISNLQQMARTVAYVQEHGYDSYEKLSDTPTLFNVRSRLLMPPHHNRLPVRDQFVEHQS